MPKPDLEALMKDSAPLFEEMADVFEAAARALRATTVLMGAKADIDALIPHMMTGLKVFDDMLALKPRVEAAIRKHGLG